MPSYSEVPYIPNTEAFLHLVNGTSNPRASGEHDVTLESAKIKRFFYTKNTLSRVVIFSFSKLVRPAGNSFLLS